ncbi:MAG: ImmA/IrrE family metallo-endopeptidase [Desulfovibrio sp.]|jgi:Zn-dependent peptidase ImmA (M78 family)|nr:ImmA/IrrE family metallo-endopeptidase [Desulfovibrio sp.]
MEAGLSLHEAALRAKVTPPRKKKDEPALTAEDRLEAWEEGRDTPSLNQLEHIAAAYRRPLLTFFLAQPPQKVETIADFRTVGGRPSSTDSPEFAALRRRITLLHQELRALAEDAENPRLPFIGSLSENTPVPLFVNTLRAALGAKFEEQRRIRDENAMLGYLRDLAQHIGIYVLLEGNVGSHHSNIPAEEFRGIALADDLVPLVVVNPNDARAAMVFTLVHELAHLWLGSSGISNFNVLGHNGADGGHEKLCNQVAAEFLVPEAELLARWRTPDGTLSSSIDTIARYFKVSGAVIGRRLLDMNIINSQEYTSLFAIYKARWVKHKEKMSLQDGAPGPTQMVKYRLGEKTLHTFISAAREGRIGLQDAARLMNIPVNRFEQALR